MINGRERDGVFETEDVIHYIEATRSRREDKAKDDTKKIFALLVDQQRHGSMKGAIGWFVTQDEPTADQRDAVRLHGKGQVKAVSFAQFQQALVDVPEYLSKRERHFFGSVADPATGNISPNVDYVPLDLFELSSGVNVSVEAITAGLQAGKSFVLLGDYGAGKSMTLRQVFFKLRDAYRAGGDPRFPIYINLREHSGQDDPSELLERHARRLGFGQPHALVSAWRAGFAILVIDGFDEVTTLGVSGARSKLREARRRSLEAVRTLIAQTPLSVGTIVAGRDHFFNSPEERSSSLGLRSSTTTVAVGELTQKQIAKYLEKIAGKSTPLPDWLPTRPLLVAYIATRGLLGEFAEVLTSIDATDGWHFLLQRIFERESKISPNLDGSTLRRILERLATVARSTTDGMGPITQQQIRAAFIQICDSEPDEQANLLLQRLPGLGVYRDEDDTRTFVDLELAEVCRARDVIDFVTDPYGMRQDEGWTQAVSSVAAFAGKTAITRVVRDLQARSDFVPTKLEVALQALDGQHSVGALRADLAALLIELGHSLVKNSIIEGEVFENYCLIVPHASADLSRLTFRNCLFQEIELTEAEGKGELPQFQSCVFMTIRGRSSKADIPDGSFDNDCTFEEFPDRAETQAAILSTKLTRGEKLILTLLRKLFVQSLSGRANSALSRGLDLNDRQLVPEAVRLLTQHGLVALYSRSDGDVWIPIRKEISRARRMLAAPTTCGDEVLTAARSIGR